MDKVITGKVMTKRDGSFKGFQYELDGKVLRKSHRFYPNGFQYGENTGKLNGGWSFGKRPDSSLERRFGVEVYRVVWDLEPKSASYLPAEARGGGGIKTDE